ncbi:MAG TPA: DUF6010 family protein, partial [Polyangiales bacterium]|nr:DUF6010 family protein [Polyangiales bacterium]
GGAHGREDTQHPHPGRRTLRSALAGLTDTRKLGLAQIPRCLSALARVARPCGVCGAGWPVLGYWALRSYCVIGICWLLHATWDLLPHSYGTPIWAFMPSSSVGCLIFDTLISVWFLAGAPALLVRERAR